MKRKIRNLLLCVLCFGVIGASWQWSDMKATEFEGNEATYNAICNGYIPADSPNRAVCEEYAQYLTNKSSNASAMVGKLNSQISAIGNDLEKISAKSRGLSTKIESVNANIASVEKTIANIETGIVEAAKNIELKEADVEERKQIVAERMKDLQVRINTNQYANYIMGASDLVEMIQRSRSIESFTEYDRKLIESLNVEVQELEAEKIEQERLKQTQEVQKANLEASRQELVALKEANEILESRYFEQQKNLIEQKNEAIRQANIASGQVEKIVFTDPVAPSDGLLMPVPSGYYSAGTWSYPSGGLHLGMDKATSIGSSVIAPANGVVLAALTATSSSGGGYLGNMIGTPYGGGNTLHILVEANNQVYAMSFFHLSPNIISTGTQISQGQTIAYTGNTGNSTGPHCHIEVFALDMDFESAIDYWNTHYDWAWGCGWSSGGTCSGAGCRIRPESLGW